jgi:hypothetical protein
MRCECYGDKYFTVDRIEEDTAVLYDENDNKTDIPVTNLPKNIKEGDILRYDCKNKAYTIDVEKTKQAKLNIEERFKKLFKKK